DMLTGGPLPNDIEEYIMFDEEEAEIEILFYIINGNKRYKVKYKLVITRSEEDTYIKQESLDYWFKSNINEDWNRVKGLIQSLAHENSILPKYRNDELINLYKDANDFIVNKKIKQKNNQSLMFSKDLIDLLNKNFGKIDEDYEILSILKHYAISNLFIIDNQKLALSDANIVLPMNFKNYGENRGTTFGVMPIGLDNPEFLPRDVVKEIEKSLIDSNKVISEIIPELRIEMKEIKFQTSKSGQEEVQVELFSCRGDVKIPMRYESDGIKKIVAVVHLLIAMYNYRSMSVVIDELDSGIFEYLLGEILEILEKRGKGQLIFTSHNLRPLEVLNKNNLVFTTVNSQNRYIKLKNIKTNNNLRDMYYRDLILGGQDEVIYDKTNSSKITRAFRKAGE
ncbi:MAG: ATP-binding protein, partial [Clostridium sp.]|nr:ATP-binding protein [Clostridium sp.]